METLVRVLAELEGRLKARLITGELEIICWLYANGPTSSRALSEKTKVSNANYQMILRRLKEEGVLIVHAGEEDRRVRHYDLAHHVRQQIDATLTRDHLPAAILNPLPPTWVSSSGVASSI